MTPSSTFFLLSFFSCSACSIWRWRFLGGVLIWQPLGKQISCHTNPPIVHFMIFFPPRISLVGHSYTDGVRETVQKPLCSRFSTVIHCISASQPTQAWVICNVAPQMMATRWFLFSELFFCGYRAATSLGGTKAVADKLILDKTSNRKTNYYLKEWRTTKWVSDFILNFLYILMCKPVKTIIHPVVWERARAYTIIDDQRSQFKRFFWL